MCQELRESEFTRDGFEMAVERQRARIRNWLGGFTITEVVVASTLLVIAVVPILKALTSAQVSSAIVERRTRSLMLAQAKLEEVRAQAIYSYDDSYTQSSAPLDGHYLCNVSDIPKSADLREITVTVGNDLDGNNNLGGNEVEVTLASYIARRR